MNKEVQYELNILSNTILDDTTYKPTIKRRKLLLDYITNLQEENKRLKDELKWWQLQCDDLEMQAGVDYE